MQERARAVGQGRVGCILWLIAALIFALIVWKAVPVKIKTAEFENFLEEQARFAARSSGEQIKARILARAEEMDLPIDPKDVVVRKGGRRVRIHCTYTIPLDFPLYTFHWRFEHVVDRPIFII